MNTVEDSIVKSVLCDKDSQHVIELTGGDEYPGAVVSSAKLGYAN